MDFFLGFEVAAIDISRSQDLALVVRNMDLDTRRQVDTVAPESRSN